MARVRKPPIPLTVVIGPLGAGKTTLINRLLGDPGFANTAVILNEFGDVALENALVERADDEIVSLGSGCICCSVRGELVAALERLLRDLDNGRVAAIGRVVIEADAAADPAAILSAVGMHPYLSLRYRPDGVIAVVAAGDVPDVLRVPIAARRLAMADVIALSKIDGADSDVPEALAALNPLAAIVDAASVTPVTITGHGAFDPAKTNVDRWLGAIDAPTSPQASISTFSLARNRSIPIFALDNYVELMGALLGNQLLRVRGMVATGEGESAVVEALGGFFRPLVLIPTPADNAPATRFTVTAAGLDADGFAAYLDAFLNEARIDTPDRVALTDNPLRIAGFSARGGGN